MDANCVLSVIYLTIMALYCYNKQKYKFSEKKVKLSENSMRGGHEYEKSNEENYSSDYGGIGCF